MLIYIFNVSSIQQGVATQGPYDPFHRFQVGVCKHQITKKFRLESKKYAETVGLNHFDRYIWLFITEGSLDSLGTVAYVVM
jgi:hypothetical protein